MILAQTSEIPPTLGELTQWLDLLLFLGGIAREPVRLSPDLPAPTLPALPPSEEKPPQDIVPESDVQQDPAKEDDRLSTTPDIPPPPITSDHLTLMREKWAVLETEQRKALKLEQLQKLHELEQIREQLHQLVIPQASKPKDQHTSELPPRDPGPTAIMNKHATVPCYQMDGPRVDLRYVRYCQVCNLIGVSGTKNCPNCFLHRKFQSGEY
ncbi:hypothetical protein TSAR_001446 [Trichomalopsis sarcophagae]|uniref:Uncharacterized protein n=1 Tax=Trichomalopsis sarcophagae TaxID=543379 RepID=A0A232EEW5_9HYME|nr:hypothetical protein TSAR_001446 [Trichomalopsis sarcophagae]